MTEISSGAAVLFGIMFVGYLMPAVIAFKYRNPHRYTIAFANIFFGWTVVGWLAVAASALLGCLIPPEEG